jgi:hypothetical protein
VCNLRMEKRGLTPNSSFEFGVCPRFSCSSYLRNLRNLRMSSGQFE